MKTFGILFLFITLPFCLSAQSNNLPPKPKKGECYCYNANKTQKWLKVDCDLTKLSKEKVTALQYKLNNLGYKIEITGCINQETNTAYIKEKKLAKKRAKKNK